MNFLALYFVLFLLIAYGNFRVFLHQLKGKQSSSYAPLIGVMAFFIGTLGLKECPIWIWLLVLLDMGTLIFIISLPFLFKEFFINSRFCRYRIYKNDKHNITLYKFNNHQTFNWQYSGKNEKMPLDNLPRLAGMGGNWQMSDHEFYLMCDDQILAKAMIDGNAIIFNEVTKNLQLLQDERLTVS